MFLLQVLGRQQYIVRPMVMEESCTPGTGSENPAIAGSSGIISEAALAHAPALTERNLREYGIPLQQAIEKVPYALTSITVGARGKRLKLEFLVYLLKSELKIRILSHYYWEFKKKTVLFRLLAVCAGNEYATIYQEIY